MLWYKAWLETRGRFLCCLITITIFSGVFVQHAIYISCSSAFPCNQEGMHHASQVDFYRLLFIAQQYLVIIWILSVVLLGMGGLVREKATGASLLTLSLPVSRTHLLAVRVGVGALEAVTLGVVPWIAVTVVSSLARMPVLFTQVVSYVLLLIAGGLVYFAMAILVSSSVGGEYTAPAVAFGAVLLTAIIFDAWLRRFNVWRLVSGDLSIDRSTYLLSGHFPWMGILVSLCAAALMLLASTFLVQKRDF